MIKNEERVIYNLGNITGEFSIAKIGNFGLPFTENVIFSVTSALLTVTFTDEGEGEYPFTDGIENEYAPLFSINEMVLDDDEFVTPFRVTDHVVPAGKPVSMNDTLLKLF